MELVFLFNVIIINKMISGAPISQYQNFCFNNYHHDFSSDIDECASSPCQNGGTCIDAVNSYTCNCDLGYSGDYCETNIDECASIPCQNGGTCTDGINSYTYICVPGHAGDNCQIGNRTWL